MNCNVRGKKLLVLTGVESHIKLVEAAKRMGVYTVVADYYQPSRATPAKLVSDEQWMTSVLEINELAQRCLDEHIDGIIAPWSDIAQIPYARLCSDLGYPCYGTVEQFELLSDKRRFKQLCIDNGVDVIPEYTKTDIAEHRVVFPVFVKPSDGYGSKGQSVCHNYDELERGVVLAKEASKTGGVIVEQYVANKNSFQVTYFFQNGKAHILRTADGYKGLPGEGLDRVALCSVSPSTYADDFMSGAYERFASMVRSIGISDGPVMAQGFYDNGTFRFYDPGFRFPGTDFEVVYKRLYGLDFMRAMVEFALTGSFGLLDIPEDIAQLDGKEAAILFPTLAAGRVGCIEGFDELRADERVLSAGSRYEPGDTVEWSCTTRQRLAEITLLTARGRLSGAIEWAQQKLEVTDVDGNDMLCQPFDPSRIK